MKSKSSGVLGGLRVIELSAFVAVPLGAMTLGQLGAEVIRIDPLGGGLDFGRWPVTDEGISLYWAGLNKGKKSVALNVRSERGRDIIQRLVTAPGEDAGILVTNLSPDWRDYEALKAVRSDLIMVKLSGNPDGAIGVDYTINASTGYPIVTGSAGGVVNHVLPAWDVIAGNMVATALLAAERRRARTGEGSLVELSLADVAFSTVGHLGHVAEVVINDTDRPSYGNHVYGSFGNEFLTLDGRRVMVTALTPRQWSALMEATETGMAMTALEAKLGIDLTDEGNRFIARNEISTILESWFSDHPYSTISERLDSHGVCWGPYRSFRELVEHDPRVDPKENPMWSVIEQPGVGSYPVPASPIHFFTSPQVPAKPAPTLGADTESTLVEVLGLDAEEIRLLHEAKVI